MRHTTSSVSYTHLDTPYECNSEITVYKPVSYTHLPYDGLRVLLKPWCTPRVWYTINMWRKSRDRLWSNRMTPDEWVHQNERFQITRMNCREISPVTSPGHVPCQCLATDGSEVELVPSVLSTTVRKVAAWVGARAFTRCRGALVVLQPWAIANTSAAQNLQIAVSYTHLDVYKRQPYSDTKSTC